MNSLCGLASVPQTKEGARQWAVRLGLSTHKVAGNGGTHTAVPLADLPADVRAALADRAQLPAVERQVDQERREQFRLLKGSQRQRAGERAGKLRRAELLIAEGATIAEAAAAVGVSRQTLWRVRTTAAELPPADRAPALAPRLRTAPEPAWAARLLKLWRTPTKRSLADVLEQLRAELPEGAAAPSYDQAKRYVRGLSSVERARGRLGPNALKGVRAFTRRTVDGLLPTDCYVADGHNFDAEITHPKGGQPCRPEITVVLDVKSRRFVGWSVALAESTWAVADALRHAVTTHGVPAIYYSDRGPGHQNAILSAMLERLGVTREKSLARNSQARGVVERFNQYLIRAARRLPTFINSDPDAKRLVFQRTRRELRTVGASPLLMPWEDFCGWLGRLQNEYNARPHSGLPKVEGRHLSPDEAWRCDLEASGFVPLLPSHEEADDLFRPYELRMTRRGEVSLWGRRYFARHLEHLDGAEVLVGYDIHDASRVWVRDLDERLVAIAGLDANARPYFPASRVEQARERRAEQKIKRKAALLERDIAELASPSVGSNPVVQAAAALAEVSRRRRRPGSEDPQRYVLAAIRGAPDGVTKSELHAKTQVLTTAQRNAALAALAERGEITAERQPTASRPSTVFRAAEPGTQRASVNVVALPAPARAEQLLYQVVEYTGSPDDDQAFARARWLDRRQAAGETLDPAEARWLEVARTESWYASLLKMERWHARIERKAV